MRRCHRHFGATVWTGTAPGEKIAPMQRTLEPEYMDTPEEACGYEAMDHTDANESAVSRFLAIGGQHCRRIIDLGTGPGDIPILLAQRLPTTDITGIDAAEEMLKLARPKAARHGLTDRVRFEQADVKALPHADASFDGVFSNTILHHIPDPLLFLQQARRVLQPGGVLLIRDLFRPASESEAQRLVDLYAADCNAYQRQLFYQSFCAALTLDEARQCASDAGLTGATVEMSSDRHYTIEIHA
jgi:ubiquinone/menaquinone biosynthesis C-methylase UbiE